VRLGVGHALARGEAVVHLHLAQIGDDVARDPAPDAHGVEALPVSEPLHRHLTRTVLGQTRKDRSRGVYRVLADPRSGAVRAHAVHPDDGPQCAVAAPFDASVGRLAEDGEVGREEVGTRLGEKIQPVQRGVDLFVVVPHPGDVDRGRGELGGQLQLHGDAGLHVDGAATPQVRHPVDFDVAGGHVVVDRHRVDETGDHHALRTAQVGAGHHCVPVTGHLEMPVSADGRLDLVGETRLTPRHAGDVADAAGEVQGACGQIERHAFSLATSSYPTAHRLGAVP